MSGLFVPRTIRTLDYSYYGWTNRTLDDSYDGLFVRWTIRMMDFSYHGLFVLWTVRTIHKYMQTNSSGQRCGLPLNTANNRQLAITTGYSCGCRQRRTAAAKTYRDFIKGLPSSTTRVIQPNGQPIKYEN